MPGLSVPAERSACRSEPSRFRSGARHPAVELSDSLFDRGVVVNPRVEIARPIGTLFITTGTGAQSRAPRSERASHLLQMVRSMVENDLRYIEIGDHRQVITQARAEHVLLRTRGC